MLLKNLKKHVKCFLFFFLLAFFVCSSSPFSLNPPSDSMFLTQRGPRKCLSSSLVRWRVDQEEVGGGWYVTRERKERGKGWKIFWLIAVTRVTVFYFILSYSFQITSPD